MKPLYRLTLVAVLCVVSLMASAGGGRPLQGVSTLAAEARDPLPNTERKRSAGAKLFARECAACHGEDARGRGKALPLAVPEVRGAAPGALMWVLTNGSMRAGMPSFAHLPAAQRWQIVEYLKSLP